MEELVANFTLEEQPVINANLSLDVHGITEHNLLANRDLPDQHPITAITGLIEALAAKQDTLVAGLNIQINGNVISATDTTYVAGPGISIVGNVISNTQTSAEWGNITGTLSAQTDLQNALNAKANTADIPTATSDLLNDSGFITLSALTPYATQTWVSQQGYLTEIPAEYVTDSELTAKGYQTAADVETAITAKGYTTMSAVEAKGYITNAALVGYATESYVTTAVGTETTNRQNADNNLQSQIDAITASSDVTDIVGTYAELQAYDTSALPPNSIIKVLQDESRNNETTYYRWVITGGVGAWSLIGEEGPYYTISAADAKFATQIALSTGLAAKQDTISDLATIRSGAALGATAVQPSDLATVATSGSYNDLSNKPTIPAAQVNADWNATSGVARILNKPTIPTVPTNVSAFTNDAGYITSSALTGYATETWVGQQGYITGITSSDVTTALGYTPYNSSNPSGYITSAALAPYVLSSSLATVATSGSYTDLSDKPTIPTVNNATLTIQKNGTNVATFTANASSNVTANIEVPTNNNQLTNGAGYITSGALNGYATESYVTTATANMQTTGNLVISISSTSTDTQYPSAKCVYDIVGDVETLINAL